MRQAGYFNLLKPPADAEMEARVSVNLEVWLGSSWAFSFAIKSCGHCVRDYQPVLHVSGPAGGSRGLVDTLIISHIISLVSYHNHIIISYMTLSSNFFFGAACATEKATEDVLDARAQAGRTCVCRRKDDRMTEGSLQSPV